MYKFLKLTILLFLFSITGIHARDLFIDYLDGDLEIQNGNDWDPLYIGDLLAGDDVVKLSGNGYAEFLFDDVKITLDRDGIYEVDAMLSQIEKSGKWGIKGSAFAKLFRDDEVEDRQSAVMGVRGDPQDEEEITWVDDDVEFLEEGKHLYKKGEFDDALLILEEGAEWYGSNYDEILFYKALCEYETGKYRIMRESLNEMDPYPDASFYGDFVLLKGNLLIESQNYIEAEELFDRYLNESEMRGDEQTVYLLSAFCSLQMEEVSEAKEKLRKAIDINPNNEAGKKASEILKSI